MNINGQSMFSTCKYVRKLNVSAADSDEEQTQHVCVCVIFHLRHILRGHVSRQGDVFKADMAFIIKGPVFHLTGRSKYRE